MNNWLALLALFTVGSAVNCPTGSAAGIPCASADGQSGTCVGAGTTKGCAALTTCDSQADPAPCGSGSFAGLCDNKQCIHFLPCDGPGTHCATGDNIGECSSGNQPKCDTLKPCKSTSDASACGGSATHVGKCNAAKLCKFTGKKVEVDYTLAGSDADRAALYANVNLAKYEKDINGGTGGTGADTDLFCTPETVANATMDCDVKSAANPLVESASNSCVMECIVPYVQKTANSRKCVTGAKWEGTPGVCEKVMCPLADGSTTIPKDVTIDNGHLECKEDFYNSAIETENHCALVCDATYYATVKSGFRCQVDKSWGGGAKGTCAKSTDLSATTTFALGPADDFAKIIAATGSVEKSAFIEKFRKSVATAAGVWLENVVINNVEAGPGRRLDERSVLVDYSILSAEDDGLPVGGGLRGIR